MSVMFPADIISNRSPVGAVQAYYGTSDPEEGNWLICDGRDTTGTAIELATVYPKLYHLLGNSNVLPDLRETTLVGAGKNTTQPIANHDEYTVGQFKDDQVQSHTHVIRQNRDDSGGGGYAMWGPNNMRGIVDFTTISQSGRQGTTTHGKQTGANWIICAR